MKLTPIYRSAAFWTTVVGSIVAIVAGIGYDAEAEAIGAVAGIVIAYLVSRGIVARAAVQATERNLAAGKDREGEINF